MNGRRFTLLLALGLATFASGRAVERLDRQTFPLPKNGTVKVDTYRGFINVVAGGDDSAMVAVRYETEKTDPEVVKRELDALQLSMELHGNELVVTARNPRETGVRFIWQDQSRIDIHIDLVVPATCNLDLSSGDGGITVGNLAGHMRARADTGTIFFRRIEGSIDAQTDSGDIVVSRCSGPVTLKTVRGNVNIGTVGGRARIETVNGDIEVQTARAGIDATAADGNISAGFADIKAESRIKTSVGDITAIVNPSEACSIHATSLWGKVLSKLAARTEAGGNGRGSLVADYNGGGPLIELSANGGYVKIRPGDPLFDN